LTANYSAATSWNWSVTNNGNGRISLSSTTTQSVTVTGQALSSKGANDISITVQVNGNSGPTSGAFLMTVEGPSYLVFLPPIKNSSPGGCPYGGFESDVYYEIYDNLGYPILGEVPTNESWTSAAQPDYTNENWIQNTPNGFTVTSGIFYDKMGRSGTNWYPYPNCPGNPLSTTTVVHWGQEWWVGSQTSGSGAPVQTDTFQDYLDHGLHLSIVSPVP
jgi:hypothetical protein